MNIATNLLQLWNYFQALAVDKPSVATSPNPLSWSPEIPSWEAVVGQTVLLLHIPGAVESIKQAPAAEEGEMKEVKQVPAGDVKVVTIIPDQNPTRTSMSLSTNPDLMPVTNQELPK